MAVLSVIWTLMNPEESRNVNHRAELEQRSNERPVLTKPCAHHTTIVDFFLPHPSPGVSPIITSITVAKV